MSKISSKNILVVSMFAVFAVLAVSMALLSGCSVSKTGKAYTPTESATVADFIKNVPADSCGYTIYLPSAKYLNNDVIALTSEITGVLSASSTCGGIKEVSTGDIGLNQGFSTSGAILIGDESAYEDSVFSSIAGKVLAKSDIPAAGATIGLGSYQGTTIFYIIGKTSADTVNALSVLKAAAQGDEQILGKLGYKAVIVTGATAADIKPVTATIVKKCALVLDGTTIIGAEDSVYGKNMNHCDGKTLFQYYCNEQNTEYKKDVFDCPYICNPTTLHCRQIDFAVISVAGATPTVNKAFDVQIYTKNLGDADYDATVILQVTLTPDIGGKGSVQTFKYSSFKAGEEKKEVVTFAPEFALVGKILITAQIMPEAQTSNVAYASDTNDKNNKETGIFEIAPCVPKWACKDSAGSLFDDKSKWDSLWSSCDKGVQTRSCEDVNKCSDNTGAPIVTQPCCTTLKATSACDATSKTLTKTYEGGIGTCPVITEACDPAASQVKYLITSNAVGAKIFVDGEGTGKVTAKEGVTLLVSPGVKHTFSLSSDDYAGTASLEVAAKTAGASEKIDLLLTPKVSKLVSSVKSTKNSDSYTLVIGDSVEDNLASITFAASLGITKTKMHTDRTINTQTDNLVIIGGACANLFAGALVGKPWVDGKPAADCYATGDTLGIGAGKVGAAIVKVYGPGDLKALGNTAAQNNNWLLIAGSEALDTRRAARAISKYLVSPQSYESTVKAVDFKICGRDIDDGYDDNCDNVMKKCKGGIEYGKCGVLDSKTSYCAPDTDHPGRKKVMTCSADQICKDGEGCVTRPQVVVGPGPVVVSGSSLAATVSWPAAIMQYKPTQFSVQPAGGTSPYAFKWEFGDAKISTEQAPKKAYKAAKVFTAKVIVTDSKGVSVSETKSLNVALAPPNTCPEDGTASKGCSVETKGMFCDDVAGELVFNCKCCSNGCNAGQTACN